nr:30S ribosomal protein S18 [Streptomyces zhaozhouensis]
MVPSALLRVRLGRRRGAAPRTGARHLRNPLTAAGITAIDDSDTNPLRWCVSDRGKIRGRRVPRLTDRQRRAMARAGENASETALPPYPSTPRVSR